MKKVLIPYFDIEGKNSYPDSYSLFSDMEKVTFNGADYWLCLYNGLLELETGPDDYAAFLEHQKNNSVKMVGMAKLGEELPEAVIVELEDYRNDTGAAQAVREGASQILRRIYSNVEIDVNAQSFVDLLLALVQFTSLTNPQAVAVYTALRNE